MAPQITKKLTVTAFLCLTGFFKPIFTRPALPEDQAIAFTLPENGDLFEGDIVMDNRLRQALNGVVSKRAFIPGIRNLELLWPHGVIMYDIAPDFPQDQRDLLHQMIEEFHNRTCVRFMRLDSGTDTEYPNYLYYTSWKSECSSSIGMMGGRQNVTLGTHCGMLGTYEHETMHALGFEHEHSRPDRDAYIEVVYSNINPKQFINFHKYSRFGLLGVERSGLFDFASIMLYNNKAFSKNGKETLRSIAQPELKFGQRLKFSSGDIKQINVAYNCQWHLKNPNYHNLYRAYHTRRAERKIVETFNGYLSDLWMRFYSDD